MGRFETLARVWVAVALVFGVGFIAFAGPFLTAVGVVLVILGLVSLMPAFRNFVDEQPSVE